MDCSECGVQDNEHALNCSHAGVTVWWCLEEERDDAELCERIVKEQYPTLFTRVFQQMCGHYALVMGINESEVENY